MSRVKESIHYKILTFTDKQLAEFIESNYVTRDDVVRSLLHELTNKLAIVQGFVQRQPAEKTLGYVDLSLSITRSIQELFKKAERLKEAS